MSCQHSETQTFLIPGTWLVQNALKKICTLTQSNWIMDASYILKSNLDFRFKSNPADYSWTSSANRNCSLFIIHHNWCKHGLKKKQKTQPTVYSLTPWQQHASCLAHLQHDWSLHGKISVTISAFYVYLCIFFLILLRLDDNLQSCSSLKISHRMYRTSK